MGANEEGATAVEYGLLVGGLAVLLAVAGPALADVLRAALGAIFDGMVGP